MVVLRSSRKKAAQDLIISPPKKQNDNGNSNTLPMTVEITAPKVALSFLAGILPFLCRHSLRLEPLQLQFVIGGTFMITLYFLVVSPVPQPLAYHNFADRRKLRSCGCSVPNYNDVLSNIPFLFFGMFGYDVVTRGMTLPYFGLALAEAAITPWEKEIAWPIFFVGVFTTGFGSMYYHWRPSNTTLVWDRLPMTIAFMSLFSIILQERLDIGERVLYPLLVIGFLTVWYWHFVDDLRPYIVVQFFPLICIPFILLFTAPGYNNASVMWIALVWYIVAKVCEVMDKEIYNLTNKVVSGHTLKHITASFGPMWLAYDLTQRQKA